MELKMAAICVKKQSAGIMMLLEPTQNAAVMMELVILGLTPKIKHVLKENSIWMLMICQSFVNYLFLQQQKGDVIYIMNLAVGLTINAAATMPMKHGATQQVTS